MSLNTTRHAGPRDASYAVAAIGALLLALIGFAPTFFLPVVRGTFRAPFVVHAHGVFAFAWLLLGIVQTQLVRTRRVALHRRLGWLGAVIATGFVLTGVSVGAWATRRDLANGGEAFALGQYVNILIELVVFGVLVAAALLVRRHREWHKRLLLLATVSMLGPAWFRLRHLFPGVPNPLVTFSLLADAVLLVVIAFEWRRTRTVHPSLYTVAPAIVLVHLAELFLSQSPWWLAVARALGAGA